MFSIIMMTILLTFFGIFPFNSELGIYRIFVGNVVIDFLWIYIISIVSGILIYMFGGNIAVSLHKIHKRLTMNKYNYKILQDSFSASRTRRILTASLVSLGIAIYLFKTSDIVNAIFVVESFDSLEPYSAMIMTETMSMFFIMLLISCFISIFFGPIWILEETGLIRERVTGGRITETDVTGKWYSSMLTGFASVSAIMAYVIIILNTILWFQILPSMIEVPLIVFTIPLISVIFAPLLAFGPISFTYLMYELSVNKHKDRIKNIIKM